MDQIYLCSIENNDCINKDNCYRYTQLLKDKNCPNTTLYKAACTEDNNYILYIDNGKNEIIRE